MNNNEQLTMIQIPESENTDLAKRRWENAFQKWSNEQSQDGYTPYGCCGYGVICDWCEDNTYGRPCVRALNKMCREKGIYLNYTNQNFEEIWQGFAENEE